MRHSSQLENPAAYCGKLIHEPSSLRPWRKTWWADGQIKDRFINSIIPEINLLRSNADTGSGLYNIQVYMRGRDKNSASPSIIISSSNKATREALYDLVANSHIPKAYPEFGISVKAMQPFESSPFRLSSGEAEVTTCSQDNTSHFDAPQSFDAEAILSPNHDPLVGRRLIASTAGTRVARSATGGVVVRFGNRCYQKTVGHIEGQERDASQQEDLKDVFDDDSDDDDDDDDDDFLQFNCDVTSRGSRTPTDQSISAAASDREGSEAGSSNETTATLNHDNEHRIAGAFSLSSNQPSIVHPSSPYHLVDSPKQAPKLDYVGSLQYNCQNSTEPSLDYAFVLLETPVDIDKVNRIWTNATADTYIQIQGVGAIPEVERDIVTVTASGGFTRGRLIPHAIHSHIHPKQTSLQKLFVVQLDTMVVDGDSGADVVDAETGLLYGHIIGGGRGTPTAYIVPAEEVFQHLADVIGMIPEIVVPNHTMVVPNDSLREAQSLSGMPRKPRKTANIIAANAESSSRCLNVASEVAINSLSSQQTAAMYTYGKLMPGQTRLARILPSEDEEAPMQCDLIEGALPDSSEGHHPYEAVSYTWGSREKPCKMSVASDVLPITRNLHAVLANLRDKHTERFLWIDAICINQEDEDEKAEQVKCMGNIYAGSSSALVWLDEATSNHTNQKALESIRSASIGPRQILLESLSFNKTNDPRQQSNRRAYDRLDSWLSGMDQYRQWIVRGPPQDETLLLTMSKPGAGNSGLMKFANEQFQSEIQRRRSTTTLIPSFFFHLRADEQHKATSGLLRNLLYQILSSQPDLQDELLECLPGQKVYGKAERLRMNLMMDVLDEFGQWQTLFRKGPSSDNRIKIFFSSQDDLHIPTVRGRSIVLGERGSHQEYKATHLSRALRIGHNRDADDLRTEIERRSRGVFLWVRLVVNSLKLRYETEQPYLSFISGTESERLPDCHASDDDLNNEMIKRYILDKSGGLAESTRSKTATIQFIHESVRDFLLKEENLSRMFTDIRLDVPWRGHDASKDNRLRFTHIETPSAFGKPSINATTTLSPFLKNMSQGIAHHADRAENDNVYQYSLLDGMLCQAMIDRCIVLKKHRLRQHTPHVMQSCTLVETAMFALIRAYASWRSCLKAENKRYELPILAASTMRIRAVVQVMLELEAERVPESTFEYVRSQLAPLVKLSNALSRNFRFEEDTDLFHQLVEDGNRFIQLFFLKAGLVNGYQDMSKMETATDAAHDGYNAISELLNDHDTGEWAFAIGKESAHVRFFSGRIGSVILAIYLASTILAIYLASATSSHSNISWTPFDGAAWNVHSEVVKIALKKD